MASNRQYRTVGLILVCGSLCLSIKLNSIAIILCAALYIYTYAINSKEARINFKRNIRLIIFFGLLPVLLLIGLLYSENTRQGFSEIEKNLSLILFPTLLLSANPLGKRDIHLLLIIFLIICCVVDLFAIGKALFYFSMGTQKTLFYIDLSRHSFFDHPVYLAFYSLFALSICIYILKGNLIFRVKINYLLLIACGVLILAILLSASKAVYALTVVYLLYEIVTSSNKLKSSYKVIMILVVIFLVIGSFKSHVISSRFKEVLSIESLVILNDNKMTDFEKINGFTLRVLFWKWTIDEMISDGSWFFGKGTGDSQDFLNILYEKRNAAITIDGKKIGYYGYNTHNILIEAFIKSGLLGALVLLSYFIFLIRLLLNCSIRPLLFFIIIFFILGFSEPLLSRNKGIVIFSFFTILSVSFENGVKHPKNNSIQTNIS